MVRLGLLLLTAATACLAAPAKNSNNNGEPSGRAQMLDPKHLNVFPNHPDWFPRAHNSTVVAHDPNVIKVQDSYYLFKGGVGITKYKSPGWDGPWKEIGTVLSGPSVINKGNRTRPWAPAVLKRGDLFYCYYTLSSQGSRNSSIGLATTKDIESNDWEDHGEIIATGTGFAANSMPFKNSNAIDPQIFIDGKDGPAYLNYGSFWHGLYQVPLSDDMMSVPNVKDLRKDDYAHLASTGHEGGRNDIEGVFMTYREPYYYLWYSRGRCCNFDKVDFDKLAKNNKEYAIHVARSKSANGPFEGPPKKDEKDKGKNKDQQGQPATEGGSKMVYGSNHDGEVFAPGGLGVMQDGDNDILYFHYLNANRPNGLKFTQAYMGYVYLHYCEDGWPVAVDKPQTEGKDPPACPTGSQPEENPSPPESEDPPSSIYLTAILNALGFDEPLPGWDDERDND